MHCGRLNRNIDYKFYGQKIHVMESENDLRVIINSDMKFKDQVVGSAVMKANKTLGMIKNWNILIKTLLMCCMVR